MTTKTTKTTRRATHPKTRRVMTAAEATTFENTSEMNIGVLNLAAEERGCECEPYQDWYTYQRWIAQGFQVQKGEKGTRITTFIPTGEEDVNGKKKLRPWTSVVFCRCQVKPIEAKPTNSN